MKATGFPLLLSMSGLICALLVLAAGELLGSREDGGGHGPTMMGGASSCASFFVGLRRPGNTHVHLANSGQNNITARLELVDESGNKRETESYDLGPYATRTVVLGRLLPELGIKASSASQDLRANAEIVFEDGSEPEAYRPGLCA